VYINQTVVPQAETVKYLGIHSDKRLTWKDHVKTKCKQLDLKTRQMYWLIGNHSPLSLENKLLIYKSAKTSVDVWNKTMGMCFQVKHSSHSALPIQTPQNYNQCPMVCLKSHPSLRPKSPVRPHGFPRKDSYSLHSPGIAPKPTHGTTSAPAKQVALKKKMDI